MGAEMPFFLSCDSSVSLKSKVLVVPVVSAANVPQLAVDLVITTLGLKLVGILDSSDLIPVVGGREDGPGITIPLELFGKPDLDVLVVQQRSPALKSRKEHFVNSLINFIKESEFAAVLLLSGVNLSERTDAQMRTPLYRIIPPRSPSESIQSSPMSNLLQVPSYSFRPSSIAQPAQPEQDVPFIPGGGLTRRILASLPADWSTPIAGVLLFVMEGDNRDDAAFMADAVARSLNIIPPVDAWKSPKSWEAGLWGSPHDQTLYG